jgi:alpha-1,6-mannosyltransferase
VRIVQVANFFTPRSGGLRTALTALGEGCAGRGIEVVRVVPGPGDDDRMVRGVREVTLRGIPAPGTGYRVMWSGERVEQVVHGLRPDRIEVHDRTTLRGLGRWATRTGVPSVVVLHERLDRLIRLWTPPRLRPFVPSGSLADRSNAHLASMFDRVVCTTDFAAEEMRRIGVEAHRVPLGVDLDAFTPPRQRRAVAEVTLATCTRLSPEKRVDLSIATLAELRRRGVDARLHVIGDGPSRRSLQQQAEGLQVTWHGFVGDRGFVAHLLGLADVALAPGPVETFGLAALEALACGTPVVANRFSALAELVTPACGALAAGSGWTLADAVQSVLAVDPRARRRAARLRAEEHPWSGSVDALLAVHGLDRELVAA